VGLQLATEADSMKYFPASNSSREVRDRMLAACRRQGIEIKCKSPVMGLSRDADSTHWHLQLEDGSVHSTSRIVSLLPTNAMRFRCLTVWVLHASAIGSGLHCTVG
jgi:predicted flavoprotein YhiN